MAGGLWTWQSNCMSADMAMHKSVFHGAQGHYVMQNDLMNYNLVLMISLNSLNSSARALVIGL